MREEEARRRVVVVESNPVYRSVIAHVVGLADADCETVANVREGRSLLQEGRFDLVILGVGIDEIPDPGQVGELRALSHAPLIILSDSYEETLESYEAGADQILPKPFVPEALLGAARTELRGPKSVVPIASRIEVGGVLFDASRRAVSRGQEVIRFTRREWELLVLLLSNLNGFVDTNQMLMRAWGPESSPEQLRTYIGRIRQKLSPLAPACELLSERGLGYCLTLRGAPVVADDEQGDIGVSAQEEA
ncbi:MAG: response regulator transcription factor [Candidatus Dormiibacterota bacterium]